MSCIPFVISLIVALLTFSKMFQGIGVLSMYMTPSAGLGRGMIGANKKGRLVFFMNLLSADPSSDPVIVAGTMCFCEHSDSASNLSAGARIVSKCQLSVV